MKIIEPVGCVDPRECGGKAFGLRLLLNYGLRVPPFFVILVDEEDGHNRSPSSLSWSQVARRVERLGGGDTAIAVRSSAILEDGVVASFAGHFKTVIGRFSEEELVESILTVARSGGSEYIPCVVQEFIEAQHGGVAFSCHPVTLDRGVVVLNWAAGGAGAIVTGSAKGMSMTFGWDSSVGTERTSWPPFGEASTRELIEGVRALESAMALPVDCEWVIDAQGELHWLQCRPVAAISRSFSLRVSAQNEQAIPPKCRGHHKVKLRLEAERERVEISAAHLVAAGPNGDAELPPLLFGKNCSSDQFSVVLIHPETVNGQVVRKFSSGANIEEVIRSALRVGALEAWRPVVICQEIWEPYVTGIAALDKEQVIIELAKGHFVPKGLVPACRIIFSAEGVPLKTVLRNQHVAYDIKEGCPVEIRVEEEIREDELQHFGELVYSSLLAMLRRRGLLIEFGIRKNGNLHSVYLIDVAVEHCNMRGDSMEEGIISPGRARGRLVDCRHIEGGSSRFDQHLQNRVVLNGGEVAETVLLASRPELSLLEIIRQFPPGSVGIIFEEAAILSHLCVLLREYGIPALELDRNIDGLIGENIEIDAETAGLMPEERIQYAK